MNQYLYVCHFSSGHIKVGRSSDPESRIAQHADRVACVGVELINKHTALCVGHVIPLESALIAACCESAKKRNQNEWFEGLDYLQVCGWASEIALKTAHFDDLSDEAPSELSRYEAIAMLGGTPKKAAQAMGYKTPHAIYMWPEFLVEAVADRVRGVAARLGESA